jgi:hypothetical protein
MNPSTSTDFKEFIRIAAMTHVHTSPYYPQSKGKIERWHKTLKGDCIRVQVPLSPEEARHIVQDYVTHYNHVRLHSAIAYVTPYDKLLGNAPAIFAERDRKLAEARDRRKQLRQTRHEQLQAHRDASRPVIDFAAVRAAITIAQVLQLLGFTPASVPAGQQHGNCPLHGSTHGTAIGFVGLGGSGSGSGCGLGSCWSRDSDQAAYSRRHRRVGLGGQEPGASLRAFHDAGTFEEAVLRAVNLGGPDVVPVHSRCAARADFGG